MPSPSETLATLCQCSGSRNDSLFIIILHGPQFR